MYKRFESLVEDSKIKIITAALKEFATNKYDDASTNNIIVDAGISKGSLFNYFGSKKGLYLYLYDYSINIVKSLKKSIDINEGDLFKRIDEVTIHKIKMHYDYPYVLEFLAIAQIEDNDSIRNLISSKEKHVYEEIYRQMYQDLDYSLFKEDIEIKKAIDIISWSMTGFSKEVLQKMSDRSIDEDLFDKTRDVRNDYSKMLKELFYK